MQSSALQGEFSACDVWLCGFSSTGGLPQLNCNSPCKNPEPWKHLPLGGISMHSNSKMFALRVRHRRKSLMWWALRGRLSNSSILKHNNGALQCLGQASPDTAIEIWLWCGVDHLLVTPGTTASPVSLTNDCLSLLCHKRCTYVSSLVCCQSINVKTLTDGCGIFCCL